MPHLGKLRNGGGCVMEAGEGRREGGGRRGAAHAEGQTAPSLAAASSQQPNSAAGRSVPFRAAPRPRLARTEAALACSSMAWSDP